MKREQRIQVLVVDDDPLHVAAIAGSVENSPSVELTVRDTETADHFEAETDLILMNMDAASKRCPSLLLLNLLEQYPACTAICYASEAWAGGGAFRAHIGRLLFVGHAELLGRLSALGEQLNATAGPQNLFPGSRVPDFCEFSTRFERLTNREMDVLCLTGKGCGVPEVSDKLGITGSTFDTHIRNIRNKFHSAGTFDLRSLAAQYGRTGRCRVFSRLDDHICPCIGKSVGHCPVHQPC